MSISHRLALIGFLSLARLAPAGEVPPLQLIGVTQIDHALTAYLRDAGSGHIFTLATGEFADGWSITDSQLGHHNEVVRIRIQRGQTGLWLGVSGASLPVAAPAALGHDQPLIDIPPSTRGPLHEQLLHRARTRHKPQARAAHREVSDLDPFPTKLSR